MARTFERPFGSAPGCIWLSQLIGSLFVPGFMFSSWVSNSFLLQKLRGLKSGGCPFTFGKLEFFQQNIFYCRSSVWVWVKIVQNGRVYPLDHL